MAATIAAASVAGLAAGQGSATRQVSGDTFEIKTEKLELTGSSMASLEGTVKCPDKYKAIGGSVDSFNFQAAWGFLTNRPTDDGTGWQVKLWVGPNPDPTAHTTSMTAYAVCIRPKPPVQTGP